MRCRQVSKRTGAVIEVVPSDEAGELDLEALERMLKAGGVKAVAITHVPTNGGVVNPAKEGILEAHPRREGSRLSRYLE